METTTTPKDLLNKVQEFVQQKIKTAGSQNKAAAQLGISAAHTMNFRDAKWKNISQKMFNRVVSKAGLSAWGNYVTTNLHIASSVAAAAQEDSAMLGLTGYTGAGKTHALRLYANKTRECYYVLIDVVMSRWQFLTEICQACGIDTDKRGNSLSSMITAICDAMDAAESPLLILDDAGKASPDIFRIIQVLYDRTENSAGILLAGTPFLLDFIQEKSRRNTKGFRELKRRVAYWETMEEISKKDVRSICTGNGISDAQVVDYFHRNISDFGTLKNMISSAINYCDEAKHVNVESLVELNEGKIWHN